MGHPSIIWFVNLSSHIVCVRVRPLSIPLRKAFEHAAHVRQVADPVVMEAELADGTVGYGETLPRPYVSGETIESVIESTRQIMLERLLSFRPRNFSESLELIDALPSEDDAGQPITAARAGLELALLDAYSRYFEVPISEAIGWLGLPGFGSPGSIGRVRYSGVLSGGDLHAVKRSLRKMRWFGLQDFKLKVGYEDDLDRVRVVIDGLGNSVETDTSLRLDANGAWRLEEAIERMTHWQNMPVHCVEQPLGRGNEQDLVGLKHAVDVKLMHDESLVTMADAERLQELGVADYLNIRISKNGGFLPSIRLAHWAQKHNVKYQLGCMVGETSILSAVGRRFLENVAQVAFAEGSYGRFLLSGDVVGRPVQFGCGGRIKPLPGLGWGIDVQPKLLEQYTAGRAIELPL